MKNLFESRRFQLVEIKRTGKKRTPSNLTLKGLPSDDGCPEKIVAAEPGTVIFAGNPRNWQSRRYGVHVRVRSDEDPHGEIIYYGLRGHFVHAGDHVQAGAAIGYCTLIPLGVEVRYNGRRADALAELGIPATIGKVLSMDKPAMLPTCR